MEKISENRKQLFDNGNYRVMSIGELVKVSQSVSIVDLKWERAFVSYGTVGPLEAHEALDFAACLVEACDIADQWTAERKGKPV